MRLARPATLAILCVLSTALPARAEIPIGDRFINFAIAGLHPAMSMNEVQTSSAAMKRAEPGVGDVMIEQYKLLVFGLYGMKPPAGAPKTHSAKQLQEFLATVISPTFRNLLEFRLETVREPESTTGDKVVMTFISSSPDGISMPLDGRVGSGELIVQNGATLSLFEPTILSAKTDVMNPGGAMGFHIGAMDRVDADLRTRAEAALSGAAARRDPPILRMVFSGIAIKIHPLPAAQVEDALVVPRVRSKDGQTVTAPIFMTIRKKLLSDSLASRWNQFWNQAPAELRLRLAF